MSRSILLQLARDSIEEVLQAQNIIDKPSLLKDHALLQEHIAISLNIYIANELRGSYENLNTDASLLNAVIIAAKRAAFEDSNFSALSVSEYLQCEIELILQTADGPISQRDSSLLEEESQK